MRESCAHAPRRQRSPIRKCQNSQGKPKQSKADPSERKSDQGAQQEVVGVNAGNSGGQAKLSEGEAG